MADEKQQHGAGKRPPFKRLSENSEHAWFKGVFAGIAYAHGWPVTWVRVAAILILCGGTNSIFYYAGTAIVLAYILAYEFAPEWDKDPEDYEERTN